MAEKTGRPTKHKPEYDKLVETHLASGKPLESFWAVVNVEYKTPWYWRKTIPSFSEAVKKGRSKFYEHMIGVGINGASSPAQMMNTGMYAMIMKNMCGWNDKSKNEIKTTAKAQAEAKVHAEKSHDITKVLEAIGSDPFLKEKLKKLLGV
jgi:hypothetical protein